MTRLLTSSLIIFLALGCEAKNDDVGGDGADEWGDEWGDESEDEDSSFVLDSDGDGLTDEEEIARGLDPTSADTDGDGYSDGAEVNSFTDPTDPNDHPYSGGWPIDSCRHDLNPTGSFALGEVVQNYMFTDQFGETLRLHDFCNHVVLIEHAGFG